MDIWDKKKRSEVMSKIRSKNTKPEVLLRKALFAKGFRFRINYKKLPGKPDIVLPKYKTVIFVHGCFWHGHDNCAIFHIPKSNVEYWENKITRNKERDMMNIEKNISLGWKVFVIWECEITKKNIQNIIDRITRSLVKERGLSIKIYEEIEDNIVKVSEEIIPYNKQT